MLCSESFWVICLSLLGAVGFWADQENYLSCSPVRGRGGRGGVRQRAYLKSLNVLFGHPLDVGEHFADNALQMGGPPSTVAAGVLWAALWPKSL